MGDPVTGAEKNVFGAASTYHDITGMPLETGIGSLPHDQQAQLHCNVIEHREGKASADAMRKKLADAKKFTSAAETLAAEGVNPTPWRPAIVNEE